MRYTCPCLATVAPTPRIDPLHIDAGASGAGQSGAARSSKRPRAAQCLTEALLRLAAPEAVTAVCPHCQQSGMIRRASFRTLPPVVMIHVKRFRCNQKLNEPLSFPSQSLDLRPLLTPSSAAAATAAMHDASQQGSRCGTWRGRGELGVYDLFALIEHKGRNASSGHYVAYVAKNSAKCATTWHSCNDTDIREVRVCFQLSVQQALACLLR
jgi:uncharacterized UBP type Zn finger protein